MTPLHAEPVLGWRVWHARAEPNGYALHSWTRDGEWPAGERMEARCARLLRAGCSEAPGAGPVCGIYAARTRDGAEALLVMLPALAGPVALGLVSLWGRVIENVGGWRAQCAYPYALELVGGDEEAAAGLRRRYLVDVC